MNISPDLKLILASQSPRRSYLLEAAGIPFEIRTEEVEEIYPPTLAARDVAPYLAELKAAGQRHLLRAANEVLLTADSVVIVDEKIYGKPKSREEAIATVLLLGGRSHTVVTGCCLLQGERKEVFAGTSAVHLNPISEQEAAWYVDTYEPYDKAGSYAIQEWAGLAKIHRIEGTYPNIMGLPVDLVYDKLVRW